MCFQTTMSLPFFTSSYHHYLFPFQSSYARAATMHLTSVAVLHTILVPLVAANCYKSGPDRVNQQFALDNIATAAGLLQGNLAAGQVRGYCLTDPNAGYQWYFSVQNTGSNGQAIGKGDIDKYLRQEVNGCGKNGGSSAHGSTRYT